MSWERFERSDRRHISRSADEYTDDEIAEMVLELVTGLVDGHLIAKSLRPDQPDRVRSYCPPEARYDYQGPQTIEVAS